MNHRSRKNERGTLLENPSKFLQIRTCMVLECTMSVPTLEEMYIHYKQQGVFLLSIMLCVHVHYKPD